MLVSTSTVALDSRFCFKDSIKILKEAGFTAYDAHLCTGKAALPAPFNGEDYLEEASKMRAFADDLGIICNQAHADYGSHLGAAEKGSPLFEATVRCMEVASILGAKGIVVHPLHYLPYISNAEFLKQENLRFYNDLLPYAEKLGIVILTENMWQRNKHNGCIIQSTCAEAKEFRDYIDMISSPYFKACLDIGHTIIAGETITNMIKTLGKDRLAALHIHDVDAICDSHTLPYTCKVDFSEMITTLKEIGYEGDITFEVKSFFEPFPDELIPSAVRLMADMGHYFKKQIEG